MSKQKTYGVRGANKAYARTELVPGVHVDVSQHQYEHGYSLFRTNHNAAQIQVGARLTRPQIEQLIRIGVPARGWKSWGERLMEEVEAIRSHAIEAAKQVSADGVEVLKRGMGNAKAAQALVSSILGTITKRVRDNALLADGDRRPIEKVMPGRQVLETLKVLRSYADMSGLAHAYNALYGSQFRQNAVKLPKEVAIDVGEASLPASLALVEGGGGKRGRDVVDEIFPEAAEWTEEECEHFALTGERPDRALVASEVMRQADLDAEDEDEENDDG